MLGYARFHLFVNRFCKEFNVEVDKLSASPRHTKERAVLVYLGGVLFYEFGCPYSYINRQLKSMIYENSCRNSYYDPLKNGFLRLKEVKRAEELVNKFWSIPISYD